VKGGEPLPAEAPAAGAPAGRETILLVEDEASLRKLSRRSLVRLGYAVIEAENGPAALELWRQNRQVIKLLFTDLVMPGGMTGMELAKGLLAEDASLKVVYTSGYSSEIAGQDLPLSEGVNFLAKPYDQKSLANIVRTLLDHG
jgi:CheY-like chemotaxis protein